MFTKSGKPLLILTLFVLQFSCKNATEDAETRHFSKYLETLHTSIPADSTNYVVISEFGCHGCISGIIDKLHDMDNAIFIVSRVAYYNYIEEQKLQVGRYLIDSTGEINRLKYHGGNAGIVQTANHTVYKIVPLQTNSLDSMLDAILK